MKHEWDDASVFGFTVCKRCCRCRNEHNAEKECKAVGLRVGQQYNAHKPKPLPTPEEALRARQTLNRIRTFQATIAALGIGARP